MPPCELAETDPVAPGAPARPAGRGRRAPAMAGGTGGSRWRWQSLGRWEVALVGFVIATVLFGDHRVQLLPQRRQLLRLRAQHRPDRPHGAAADVHRLTGEIDLSVASTLGLACTLLGYLFEHGWPMPLAIVTVLAMGVVTGTFNGVLVTRLGLPSLAVTIGTLTLYRGIAEIILGSSAVHRVPRLLRPSGHVAHPGHGVHLDPRDLRRPGHCFRRGPACHAAGPVAVRHRAQQGHRRFSPGSGSQRIKLLLYTLSGLICAAAGSCGLFSTPVPATTPARA